MLGFTCASAIRTAVARRTNLAAYAVEPAGMPTPIPMGIPMSMGIAFSRAQKFLVCLRSRGIYVSRRGG